MKKLLRYAMLSLIAITTAGTVLAQSSEFSNVLEIELRSTVVIKNNKTVVGYALFYMVDKMKKGNLYRLEILDENLKSIGNNEFEGSKSMTLTDAVYESEHIMLAFNDPKKEEGTERFVRVYDLKGKLTGTVLYSPEEGKKGMFGAAVAEQAEKMYNGTTNVEGKGFINVYQNKIKTGGAVVQMVDQKGKLKWEKTFTAEKGDRQDVYLSAATSNVILLFSGERESIMKAESKNFFIGLDPANGKQLFKKSLEIGGYALEPQFFKLDAAGKLNIISLLTAEDDKFYKAKPLGISLASIDQKTGVITTEKNLLYEKELSTVIDMKSATKTEEGYLHIHDVDIMLDGSKVMVGEFFRRTVSASGVALNVLANLGGGAGKVAPTTQISVGDLFLLRMDKNNKITSLEKIEKKTTRYMLPTDGLSLGLIQRYMTQIGAFGYIYTDENPDNNQKTVLVEGTFEGERYGTNAITFDEKKGNKIKKLTVDAKGRDQVRIMRAKPGHVLVSKYTKKDKKLTLNLERVD